MDTPLPASKRRVLVVSGVLAGLLTHYGVEAYRPYAKDHGLVDLGLASSIPSFGGAIAMMFIAAATISSGRKSALSAANAMACGCLTYEFLQPLLRSGVFDWCDVLYGAVGWIVGAMALRAIIASPPLLRSNSS